MRLLSLLMGCTFVLLSFVTLAQGPQKIAGYQIADVKWMAGKWRSEDESVLVEEQWTTPAGGAMLGVSRTVKGGRMVAFEYLRIVERDRQLIYIAQPDGRPPTEFRSTVVTPESATFENPAHDFPKMIRYEKRRDNTLQATVSDGRDRKQMFVFRPE